MKRVKTILTHPGGAHKDEFLSCCVMLAIFPTCIVRRDPTDEELLDPEICVIDVGHKHEPEFSNFDHHQFPKDHPPICSLSLILQHYGLYEDAKRFCEWLETAEWFDCRGPEDTSKWLGVERSALGRLNSPIDVTVLRRFARYEILCPGDTIWELMRMIGEDLLDFIKGLRKRLAYVENHAEIWELREGDKAFSVLYMPKGENASEDSSMGMVRYIESLENSDDIIAMVYPDRRGDGYGLSRHKDNLLLDFTKIEDEEDIHFAHKRGFMAKTSSTDEPRLKELLLKVYCG